MTTSTLDSLLSLTAAQRQTLLQTLTDQEAAALLYDWPLWARPGQVAPPGDWRIWLVLAGRGYGKTRVGAEWMREQVKQFPLVNMIGATTDDIRDIMVEGESGIMAVCPPWERPVYRPSLMRLDWPNGAKTLYFTAEKPERLRGKQHMRLWADELAAWQYVDETWDMAILGLRLGHDPRALITTTPKPIPLLRELVEDETVAITKGATYENRDNLAPAFFTQLITKYEGTRLGRQELDAELLLDEGLAYRVIHGVHVVPPLDIPPSWRRLESMDFGSTSPTAWGAHAVDYDGNVITFDLYYQPGLVSEHAAAILAKRPSWWPEGAEAEEAAKREWRDWQERPKLPPGLTVATGAVCYADPSISASHGVENRWGEPASIETEFRQHGIGFVHANNDRRAGYMRVAEMVKCDPERAFPAWHPRAGEKGAPRYFVVDTAATEPLVRQLRDAPLESPDAPRSRFPGEAVDVEWESGSGHAHAMLRYGLMSRPAAAKPAVVVAEDPRRALLDRRRARTSKPRSKYVDI